MSTNGKAPPGLEFPCELPIKAMGRAESDLVERVIEVVARHVTVDPDRVRTRPSSEGNFQSVTVVVPLNDREQMETIYRELGALDEVLWTL